MNRCIWIPVIVLLGAGVFAAQEQGFPLVSGVCLLENSAYRTGLPPGKVTIAMQVRTDTLFKISSGDRVLQAGLFREGFNSIALYSKDFFRNSGTHTFILECKAGESVVVKEIRIDIRMVPLYFVPKKGEEKKQHVFTLSFLIGDQLIYSTRKFALGDISFKLELPPWEGQYDPFGLIDDKEKPSSGVPILGAVAVLYQLGKSLAPAKDMDEENSAPQKRQRIETTFLKTNVSGDLWQWKGLITIKASDKTDDGVSFH